MDLEYLSGLWQQDDGGTRFSIPADDLHESVRRSANRLERSIRWRDWRELVGLILVGTFFFYLALIEMPARLDTDWWEHWDWMLLGATCWGTGAMFGCIRRKGRQYRPQSDDDIRTTLERQCDSLRYQVGLLNRVATWYILPTVVPWTILIMRSFPASWKWPYFLFLLCIFGLVIAGNRWYAKHRLTPRLKANEQLLKEVL